MKKILSILCLLLLTACVSPASDMTSEQVAKLSNSQLCHLRNSYPWEAKTETEIGRRGINCDPLYLECKYQGFEDNTPEMRFCINSLEEQYALQKRLKEEEQKRQTAEILRDREIRRNRSTAQGYPFPPNFPFD